MANTNNLENTQTHDLLLESNQAPKVSVIVPVYKVEKYLPECIESILAQTFTDFELILVDDGSPDNSGKICDGYAERDSRIRVFHKKNGGVTSARRLGVENAKGEWVMFVDGDDSVPSNGMLLLSEHCKVDAVDLIEGEFSYLGESESSREGQKKNPLVVSGLAYGQELATHRMFWKTAPWGKIIRRRTLEEGDGMSAPAWMHMGEDFFMLLCISRVSRKCVRVFDCVYNYRKNPQGACRTFSPSMKYFERWFRELERKFLRMAVPWDRVLDTVRCARYGTLFLSASDFSLKNEFIKETIMKSRQCENIGKVSRMCFWFSVFLPRCTSLNRFLVKMLLSCAVSARRLSRWR